MNHSLVCRWNYGRLSGKVIALNKNIPANNRHTPPPTIAIQYSGVVSSHEFQSHVHFTVSSGATSRMSASPAAASSKAKNSSLPRCPDAVDG